MGISRFWLEAQEHKTKIDPISTVLIIGTMLLFSVQMFVFLPNYSEPKVAEIVIRNLIAFVFLLAGLGGMLFFGVHVPTPETRGGDIDLQISTAEWTLILLWTAIDLMFIVVINAVTFQYSSLWKLSFIDYPQSKMQWIMFATAIGWTEEVFFRGMMLPAVSRASGKVVAVLACTLAWLGFHFGVYGLSMEPLAIIFFSGLALSVSFIATMNRLTTVMLPHGINNFIAVGTQGATLEVPIGNMVLPLIMVMKR